MKGSSMEGATALIWCAKQRDDCAEAAQVLIEAGIDVAARDAEGKTALDHARERAPRVAGLLAAL